MSLEEPTGQLNATNGEAVQTLADEAGITGHDQELVLACQLVGEKLGLEVRTPPPSAWQGRKLTLGDITAASRIRERAVLLRENWWHNDNGPLLGFLEEGERPVALLPKLPGRYNLVDTITRDVEPVTASVASRLRPVAHMLYQSLPLKPLSASNLLHLAFWGQRRDLLTIMLTGVGIGILATTIPIATALLIDTIIPNDERGLLLTMGLILFIVTLASASFDMAQRFAILRIDGRAGVSLQAAIWDRLLRLPASFFCRYTSGDLTARAMGVEAIRRNVTEGTISAILAGIFSLFYLLLIFVYDARLAWVATILVLLPMPVTLLTARSSIRHNRTITDLNGRLSGLVLQIITGIGKLRVAGAEGRALSAWGRDYNNMRRATFSASTSANRLVVFNGTYPVLATLFIFALVVSPQAGQVSTGSFLAFFAAFSMLLAATLSLNTAFLTIAGEVPVFERLRPILETEPEVDDSKLDPGELSGAVEIGNLSFRYHEDGPLILRNISLRIDPGEFVAIVGPSGSGKSTLFRLLVGFEKPEKGTIYYNGQDLDRLDIRAVRRQIGTILQQSHVSPTRIYKNITGNTALTIEDAWEAARLAGLDNDIEQMPMGMHTQISEGGSTLSAGQRQQLLIAGAIAKRPRVLYLDEASSALDNRTQAAVSQSLEQLEATRLVIAHRLSTIRHADRIYVLNRGELVQSGSYEELANQPGIFADLVHRQLGG